jgi:hypothetical protein
MNAHILKQMEDIRKHAEKKFEGNSSRIEAYILRRMEDIRKHDFEAGSAEYKEQIRTLQQQQLGPFHIPNAEIIKIQQKIEPRLSLLEQYFETRFLNQEKHFEARLAEQHKQFEAMLEKKQMQFENHMKQHPSKTLAVAVAVAVEAEEQPIYVHETHKNDTKQQSTTISKKKGDSVEHCIEELYKLIEQTDNENAKRMLEQTIVSLLDTK